MPAQLSQRQALLALNALPHVGPVTLRRLMDVFNRDAVAVLSAPRAQLLEVEGIGKKVADTLIDWPDQFDLAKEVTHMRRTGTRFFIQEDVKYPELLREIYDPPIGLYWQGEYIVDRPCVAIVGTRRSTLYGRRVAKRIAAELARLGFCVVSGMASGIDTAAHEGALEVGGKTVAVFGCGLDTIYPPENLDLYQKIVAHGAVVSEFPFGRRADRQTFPMRNRVVAGICQGVVVVESAASGGSMITARFAGEQGRTLMAVPGRIDQASSVGCHQLIRDGAIMVTSVDDILEELRYQRTQFPGEESQLNLGGEDTAQLQVSEAEQVVLDCFAGGEFGLLDDIAERLGKPIAELSGILMSLELKRLIVKRADGRFEAK
ncbi:DNA-processing protein DprA [Opitutales bacterium]|nr:DNA-processing protein DprA [Opitutales bacterium]MDB2506599.1 DNA-processing protein DprA [Opitutales bacterium]